MKKFIPLVLSLLALSLTSCNNSAPSEKHEHTIISISVFRDAYKRTYISGNDFDDDGLVVR